MSRLEHKDLFASLAIVRSRRASDALKRQLDSFAERVLAGSRPIRGEEALGKGLPVYRSHGTPWPHGRRAFLAKTPPFTSGNPDPQYTARTDGTAEGAYFNIEARGNPLQGFLSAGVSGGVWRNADWTGETFYSELPDRWIGGDAISARASILQAADLPQRLGSQIAVSAWVYWNPVYPNWAEGGFGTTNLIYDAFYMEPGLPNAPVNGLVGVSASLELSVSLVSGEQEVLNASTATNVLCVGANAEYYGNVDDKVEAPFLFFDFIAAGNPWQLIPLSVTLPANAEADQMVVEVSLNVSGCRAGVNDPNAGNVLIAFQDLYYGVLPVGFKPSSPNSFAIQRIVAISPY